MIPFEATTLHNGLRVIAHRDPGTPLVAVEVLYRVGSRDDPPQRTGLAHLFEHLMFGGSAHASNFDDALQLAGGENNAFTNADATNYYNTLPACNLEIALWLESDRMCCLKLDEATLRIQQQVVIEEFKETTYGEPYGDAWHHLLALAWKHHPYRWPTIGQSPAHIAAISLEDIRAFYDRYYHPANAVLVIAGNVNPHHALVQAEKWFGELPARPMPLRQLPVENPQGPRKAEVHGNVKVEALFLAWHAPARTHPDYHAAELISDLLDNGPSARLYRRLMRERKLASHIDCYLSSHIGPSLFVIEGRPAKGVSLVQLELAIREEIARLCEELPSMRELTKVQNKAEANLLFGEIQVLHKALNLAFFEMLGDAAMIQTEHLKYRQVQRHDIQRVAQQMCSPEREIVLYYLPQQ